MADAFLDLIFKPSSDDVLASPANINAWRQELWVGKRRPDHGFQLATALISHMDKALVREGVEILEGLSFQYWQIARGESTNDVSKDAERAFASRDSGTVRLTECCFYLSIGHAKLGDSVKARSTVEKMLKLTPGHPQGLALRDRLENDLFQSGVKGLLGLAGAVIGAGIVLGALSRGRGPR
jgi:hypothetical protein